MAGAYYVRPNWRLPQRVIKNSVTAAVAEQRQRETSTRVIGQRSSACWTCLRRLQED